MSPRKTGADKTRFTLWLPDDLMDRLTHIQQAHAKESLAEVVRDGLMVYVDLLKAREEGAERERREERPAESRGFPVPGHHGESAISIFTALRCARSAKASAI